jgi:hypothetical protein
MSARLRHDQLFAAPGSPSRDRAKALNDCDAATAASTAAVANVVRFRMACSP